jgi:streptogramin lyase
VSGGAGVLNSISNSRGIALDGAGALWIGNTGSTNVQPNLAEIIPSLISNDQFAGYVSSSLSAGPLMVAVDGTGNVWVLLANNTITEYVGIATPAITPIGLAVKNTKIGKTP